MLALQPESAGSAGSEQSSGRSYRTLGMDRSKTGTSTEPAVIMSADMCAIIHHRGPGTAKHRSDKS
jgi:hypothetical protein